MKFRKITDLTDLISSGRIDAIYIVRPRNSPEILRIRMRRGKQWDELWVHASAFVSEKGTDVILQNALNTILDHVSPG
ncbi:MAG: hypothetical protein V4719_13945 [Planctomycetota bacterium]